MGERQRAQQMLEAMVGWVRRARLSPQKKYGGQVGVREQTQKIRIWGSASVLSEAEEEMEIEPQTQMSQMCQAEDQDADSVKMWKAKLFS